MKATVKIIAALFALLLTACSEPPKLVAASDICNEEYKGEEVITEGIIQLPDSFYSTGASVTMAFEAPGGKYRIPALHIYTGNKDNEKRNMMEPLQEGYLEEDVKIYDDKGQLVKLGDKIRVTGEVLGGSKEWCEIAVAKIEKVN